jgi:hypothetical protein
VWGETHRIERERAHTIRWLDQQHRKRPSHTHIMYLYSNFPNQGASFKARRDSSEW